MQLTGKHVMWAFEAKVAIPPQNCWLYGVPKYMFSYE
jgi:hypothetical protein